MKSMRTLPSQSRGFTLVEVMIAASLGSLVFAAVISLTLFGTRSSIAIVNYSDLDSKSRYALDVLGREIRNATAVTSIQTNYPSCSITLTNVDEGATVLLAYDANARTVTIDKTGQPTVTALTGCDRWNFSLYQRTPWVTPTNIMYYPATNITGALDLSLCKLINLSWKCSRTILAQKVNTESVQAAQIVLRNKQ
jgi:prepilin-type N-terminal cleavage/methylation domain-containing protein